MTKVIIQNRKLRSIYLHVARNMVIGGVLIAIALFIGMCGYHFLEKLSWLDAYLNASMILAGMGPIAVMKTDAGKFFAGSYALFSGLFFMAIVVIILSPVIHQFFRKIHLESGKAEN